MKITLISMAATVSLGACVIPRQPDTVLQPFPEPIRLLPAGTDKFTEYFVDWDSISGHPGLLRYRLWGRSAEFFVANAFIYSASIAVNCSERKRLETSITIKNKRQGAITTNFASSVELRQIFEQTRQAAELDLVCTSLASRLAGSPAPPQADRSLIDSLTRLPSTGSVKTQPNNIFSTEAIGASLPDRQQVVSFFEGVATVAAIAFLIIGAGTAAKTGTYPDDIFTAPSLQAPPSRIISRKYGTVIDYQDTPSGRTIRNFDSGVKYTLEGNSIKGTDGSRFQIRGTQIISSDGQIFERVGSTLIRSSDGRECQITGSFMSCN